MCQQQTYFGPTIIEASGDDDQLITTEDIEDVVEDGIKKGKA